MSIHDRALSPPAPTGSRISDKIIKLIRGVVPDMTGEWVYGAIAGLVAVHLVMVWYAYRRRRRVGAVTDQSGEAGHGTDDTIECHQCGEHNRPEYRYCQQCVSKLPTGASSLESHRVTGKRRVF